MEKEEEKVIMQKERYIFIDFAKWYMSIVIIVFHYNLFFLGGKNRYMMQGGYLVVDVFFMISGFFLGSAVCQKERSQIKVWETIKKKVSNIYLHYAMATVFITVFMLLNRGGDMDGYSSVYKAGQFIGEMLMIQEWGLPFFVPFYNGQTWYVSAMMAAVIIIVIACKIVLPEKRNVILGLICAFIYFFIALFLKNLHIHGTVLHVSTGVIRGIAGVSLGCLLYAWKQKKQGRQKAGGLLALIFVGFCTILCMVNRDSYIDFLVIPIGIGVIWFGTDIKTKNAGINKIAALFSEWSYVIYLNQGLIRYVMNKYFQSYSCSAYVLCCMLVALIIVVIVSVCKRGVQKCRNRL